METKSLRESPYILTCVMKNGVPYNSGIFYVKDLDDLRNERIRRAFYVLVANELAYDDLQFVSTKHVTSDDCIYISDHAFKRMKERAGWNRDAALRMAGKVYEKGKRIQPTTARLQKWFDQKMIIYKGSMVSREFVLYGDYLFIFKNNILITMYQFDVKNLFNNDTRTYRHKKNSIYRYAS